MKTRIYAAPAVVLKQRAVLLKTIGYFNKLLVTLWINFRLSQLPNKMYIIIVLYGKGLIYSKQTF